MKFILDHDQFLFHIIHLSLNISNNLDRHIKFSLVHRNLYSSTEQSNFDKLQLQSKLHDG